MKRSSSETSLSKAVQNAALQRETQSTSSSPQNTQNGTFSETRDTKISTSANKESHSIDILESNTNSENIQESYLCDSLDTIKKQEFNTKDSNKPDILKIKEFISSTKLPENIQIENQIFVYMANIELNDTKNSDIPNNNNTTTNDRAVVEFPSSTGNGTLDPTSNTNNTATNTTNIPNGNAEQATREGNIPTQLPPPYTPAQPVPNLNNPSVVVVNPNMIISTPYQPATIELVNGVPGQPINTVCPNCRTQVTSIVRGQFCVRV
ncbi:hypothetical protein BB559_005097 [Furculomyces boomerangus]|uniref:Uncharacterized protein n=1 Tax=Furculomyces boomerangus TaxID=61424 RepID=A0A2T9YAS7_9FUNG|nr:hypothetical protein BB559_005097 [Furculomyces boomerangus]